MIITNEVFEKLLRLPGYIYSSLDITIIIAWAGALVALSSAKSAKKQLKILESQDLKRKPNLNIEIRDSYNVLNDKNDNLEYIFELLIKNNTDINNSVVRAQCKIKYEVDKRTFFNVSEYMEPLKITENLTTTSLPYTINANSSDRIKCCFIFPYKQIMNLNIINYSIILYDTHDNSYQDSVIIVRGEFKHESF